MTKRRKKTKYSFEEDEDEDEEENEGAGSFKPNDPVVQLCQQFPKVPRGDITRSKFQIQFQKKSNIPTISWNHPEFSLRNF